MMVMSSTLFTIGNLNKGLSLTSFINCNSGNNSNGFGVLKVPAFKIVPFSGLSLKLFRMKNRADFISCYKLLPCEYLSFSNSGILSVSLRKFVILYAQGKVRNNAKNQYFQGLCIQYYFNFGSYPKSQQNPDIGQTLFISFFLCYSTFFLAGCTTEKNTVVSR